MEVVFWVSLVWEPYKYSSLDSDKQSLPFYDLRHVHVEGEASTDSLNIVIRFPKITANRSS